MATIPTIGGTTQVQSAPVGAAPRSTQGEQAVLAGQSALARGISDVGGTVGNFVLLSQQVRNEGDLTKGKLAMQRASADIQAALESEAEADNWETVAQQRIATASKEVFTAGSGRELAPVVRRQLQEQFAAWSQDTALTVRNQALRKINKDNDALFKEEQQQAINAGDMDAAREVVTKRWRLGLLSDKEAEIALQHAAHDIDIQAVNRSINRDPVAAVEMLEDQTPGGRYRHFDKLSESERLSALRSAKNARETMRAENTQAFAEEIYEAQNNNAVVTNLDRRLDVAVASKRILPSQANNLKRLAAGERSTSEQARVGSALWAEAIALDRQDPEYIQKSMKIRAEASALEPVVREPIMDALKAQDQDTVTEDLRDAFAAFDRDFRANVFGNVQTWTAAEVRQLNKAQRKHFGNPQEGDPKDWGAFDTASEGLWRSKKAFRDWLNANPKATFDEMRKQRAKLVSTHWQADIGERVVDELSGASQ